MNKKLRLLAFLFSLAISQTVFAEGQCSAEGHCAKNTHQSCGCTKSVEHKLEKLTKKLNLSTEQQTKIKAILVQSKAQRVERKKELATIHHKIKLLSKEDKLDEAKLDVLLNQKKALNKTIIKNKFMVREQIYSVLNAQQKVQYNELVKNWKQKHLDTLKNRSNNKSS